MSDDDYAISVVLSAPVLWHWVLCKQNIIVSLAPLLVLLDLLGLEVAIG